MELVISEQLYSVACYQYEKENITKIYQKQIDSILEDYSSKMQVYISENDGLYQHVLEPYDHQYDTLYEDLYNDYGEYMGKLNKELIEQETQQLVEMDEIIQVLKSLQKSVLEFCESVEQYSVPNIKQRIADLDESYEKKIKEVDEEMLKRLESYQMKEEVDGLEVLKAYEKVVDELKAKLGANIACVDPETLNTFRKTRDCIYYLKENIRHIRKKLLAIQNVSGSNITGFIQRKEKYIEDYKREFEKNKEEENQLMKEVKDTKLQTDKELNELEAEMNLKETEHVSELSDLQVEFENNKALHKKEIEDAIKEAQFNEMLSGNLLEKKRELENEESDLEAATRVSQESISKRIDALNELIEKTKEKNQEIIEKVTKESNFDIEQESERFITAKQNIEVEFIRAKDEENKHIDQKRQEANEAKERMEKYTALEKEKADLVELLKILKDEHSEKVEALIDDTTEVDDATESFTNSKESISIEEKTKQKSNDEVIRLMEKQFAEELINMRDHNDQLLKESLNDIVAEYKRMENDAEIQGSEEYKKLVEEYESINIDSDSSADELKEEESALVQKKKDLHELILNQRSQLHHDFSNELSTEDERYQQTLMSLLSYEQEGDEFVLTELKKKHKETIKPLNEEYEKLKSQLNRKAPIREDLSHIIENSEEVQKVREELRRVKKEMDLKMRAKELEVAALMSEDIAENEQKKEEILQMIENTKVNCDQKTAARDQNIEKMKDSLQNIGSSLDNNIEFANREFELNRGILEKNGLSKINVLKNQIGILRKMYESKQQELPKERTEQRVKLDNHAFEVSNLIESKLSALYEKKAAFVKQYDDAVKQREFNLNVIKEAYMNKPLGEKEKKALDDLSRKKKYLDNLRNIEVRTVKKYATLERKQENDFNERFGNQLKIGFVMNNQGPERRSYSSTTMRTSPLPPLNSPRENHVFC